MFNLAINQGSIMFRYSLIFFLLIVKSYERQYHFWCRKYYLKSLVNCLFQCDYILITDDETDRVRCRIEYAKDLYCVPRPWDIWNKDIALAREYCNCMIGCDAYIQSLNVIHSRVDLLFCDAKCRDGFDKKLPEHLIRRFNGTMIHYPPWTCDNPRVT